MRNIGKLLVIMLSQVLLVFVGCDSSEKIKNEDRGVKISSKEIATTGEKRLALVIGNADYKVAGLKNPVNDARDMASNLKNLGFKVVLKLNAGNKAMNKAISKFGKDLARNGGAGLFYFAGHGIQVKGSNYLIPIGADIRDEDDVPYEAVDAGRVLDKMESAGNPLNIVFLDACRNNPYKRSFRSASRGLVGVNAPTGTLVSYATAAGSVASDGEGSNGVYTEKLIHFMNQPGLELSQMMKSVRGAVRIDTNKEQTPFESSSLIGDFYFAGKGSHEIQAVLPAVTIKAKPAVPTVKKTLKAEKSVKSSRVNKRLDKMMEGWE